MEDIYKNLKHGRLTVWSINLLIWIIMFLSPLVFLNHGRGMTLIQYICMCAAPLAILVVYYTNFLLLAPRYYIKGKKNIFWASNLVLVLILSVCLHLWMENMRELWAERLMPPVPPVNDLLPFGHRISFFLRDMFYMAVAAAVATTVYISMRWQAAENARREAEKARAEAELKNLRAQINPHFLLNTLNNIYALTAINTPKAQQAILQLGKLLRHVLYDNDQPQVSLASEIEFITNYVNLMKIRFSGNVDIRMDTNVAPSANLTVPHSSSYP